MTTRLEMVAGEDKSFPLQCWLEGAMIPPAFVASDAMTSVVSPGEGEAALFAPAVAWWTDPDPVAGAAAQTGYDQGQVLVSVSAADSLLVTAEAAHVLEVWRRPAGTSLRSCVWRGGLVVHYAAGAGRPRLPTYCRYQDMLDFGPWCKYLAEEGDEAGFYDQRLEARLWLDDLIVRSDRGGGLFPFGTSGVPHTQWSGWLASRRSPMPSTWIRDQLWGGFVSGTVAVGSRGVGYATPPVVTAAPPPPSPLPQVGPRQKPARFAAVLDGAGGVGAVLVQDPGFGYPPGSSLPLSFSGGGGSGAAATASVDPGRLFRRDQVRRLAAFKALSLVGLSQVGNNPQHVAYGEYCAARASEELTGFTAELDLDGDGWPDYAIPTFLTNTIYK